MLAQHEAVSGNEVATLLTLLTEAPLGGRTVSIDAGLLTAQATQTITEQHGDCVGSVKGNQAAVQGLLDVWVAEAVFPPGRTSRAAACTGGRDCAIATVEAPGGSSGGVSA